MVRYYKKVEVGKPWQECTKEEYDQLPEDQRKIVTDIYNAFVRKKYLKKVTVETPWTQPLATDYSTPVEGGNMVISAESEGSGSYSYNAVNPMRHVQPPTSPGQCTIASSWKGSGVYWWQVKFPYKLKITAIDLYNAYQSYTNFKEVRLYTDNTKATQIGVVTDGTTTAYEKKVVQNIPKQGIITDTVYLLFMSKHATSPYNDIGFGGITIYATKVDVGWQPCTKEEYNQLADNLRRQVRGLYASELNDKAYLGNRVALMHKVIKDVPWEQPYLTSNGTYGVDELATVTINTNYDTGAFRPFGSGEVSYRSWDNVMYWRFSTKKAIKITKFTINTSCSSGTLYGSKTNADGSWVTLGTWSGTGGHDHVTPAAINNITVDDYFNYFQIAGVSATYAAGYGYFNHFNTARVTATYKTEVLVLQ